MLRLFINYYWDDFEPRRQELDECLRRNVASECFAAIWVLNPPGTSLSVDSDKIRPLDYTFLPQQHPSQRPTFNHFLSVAFEESQAKDINVIANNDIYFDETLRLAEQITDNEMLALTRWNDTKKGLHFYNNNGSQDVWIFRGKPRPIAFTNFPQGYPGCDARFAYEALRAGYRVSNPSRTIRVYHLHRSGFRRYPANDGRSPLRISRPYLYLRPCKLKERTLNPARFRVIIS